MSGGEVTIQGSVGDAGAGMTGGTLLVKGHAGQGLDSGMKGGLVMVMGSVGSNPGLGMSDGRIVLELPPPGEVSMRAITKLRLRNYPKKLTL